jgi:hypothetical protein
MTGRSSVLMTFAFAFTSIAPQQTRRQFGAL